MTDNPFDDKWGLHAFQTFSRVAYLDLKKGLLASLQASQSKPTNVDVDRLKNKSTKKPANEYAGASGAVLRLVDESARKLGVKPENARKHI